MSSSQQPSWTAHLFGKQNGGVKRQPYSFALDTADAHRRVEMRWMRNMAALSMRIAMRTNLDRCLTCKKLGSKV